MTPPLLITIPLLLAILVGCSSKKSDAPPPPPVTVPHQSIKGPWGAISNGLSLHANLPKSSYTPGEPLLVRLAVGNFGPTPRNLPAMPSEPRVDLKGDLLVLIVTVTDPPAAQLSPGLAHPMVIQGPRLAPGTYRLRVIIDSPKRSADQAPAWDGRLVSTDLSVTVAPAP